MMNGDCCRVKCEVLAVSVISRQWLLFAPFTVTDNVMLFMKQVNGEVCEGEVWKMDVNHKRTDYLSWDE